MSVLSNWKSHEHFAASDLLFDNTRIAVFFTILLNENKPYYFIVGL